MSPGRGRAALAAAIMVVAACGEGAELTAPEEIPSAAAAAVYDGKDPYGLQELAAILTSATPPSRTTLGDDVLVRLAAPGRFVAGAPDMPLEVQPAGREARLERAAPGISVARQRLRIFNPATGNQFDVDVPSRLLEEIHAAAERTGLTRGTEAVDDPARAEGVGDPRRSARSGGLVAAGWSNGVDTRIPFLVTTTTWPLRSIAQFTYGGSDSRCTGTLIGPRHVITAAHCLANQGTSTWLMPAVRPGRTPSSSPYGVSAASAANGGLYFVPWQWTDPNTANPRQWDWGMIVLPDRLGDLTGWMGYVARGFSALSNVYNWNRGYPSCSSSFIERPANCQTAAMYGDLLDCELGSGLYPNPGGWHRLLSVSCDSGRGHSGSAVYHYFFDPALGKYWPVVSMVMVSHECLICGSNVDYPNWNRRLTPDELPIITYIRQLFP